MRDAPFYFCASPHYTVQKYLHLLQLLSASLALFCTHRQQTDFPQHQCTATCAWGPWGLPISWRKLSISGSLVLSFVAIFSFNDSCPAPLLMPQGSVPALYFVPRLMPSSSFLPQCWHPPSIQGWVTSSRKPSQTPIVQNDSFSLIPICSKYWKTYCSCR